MRHLNTVYNMSHTLSVGARASPLSQAQVDEVLVEVRKYSPTISFTITFIETTGDKDKQTPLWAVRQTDFFTKELEERQLEKQFRISIHSAKDLPKKLSDGLCVAALTRGVSSKDCLILKEGQTVEQLPLNATIGTSSERRTQAIKRLRKDLQPISIRGTIHERLALLETDHVHGIIMAEAALIRLKLDHVQRIHLECEEEPLQGRLAIIVRENDHEMKQLFSVLHVPP